MNEEIMQQLGELRRKLEGADMVDLDQVNDMERALKKALVIGDLENHGGIKLIKGWITEMKDSIESQLRNSRGPDNLSEAQDWLITRRMLFAKIDIYNWLLDLFTVARNQVGAIGEDIKRELE